MTLQEIKDSYAVSKCYENWKDLFLTLTDGYYSIKKFEFQEHENEVMKIYARECLKFAAENEDLDVTINNSRTMKYDAVNYYDEGLWGHETKRVVVSKESITNEKNIIL